jgi:hypothetical protein
LECWLTGYHSTFCTFNNCAVLHCAAVYCRKPFTAASLVEELSDTIPGFQDSALFTPPPAAAAAAAAPAEQGGSNDGGSSGSNGGGSSSSSIKVVYVRKAQALAAELALRFGREDTRFAFEDTPKLSADSGK